MRKAIVFSEDRDLKDRLRQIFSPSKCQCDEIRDRSALLDQAGALPYDLVVLDSRSVGGEMDLVSILRGEGGSKILWVTPENQIGGAAEAIRRGADFYLTLPLNESFLRQVLGEWEREASEREAFASPTPPQGFDSSEIVGNSQALHRVFMMASRVAPTDSPVLITGETGVGKEMVARTIHRLSHRANKPFVAVNCGAIPENLLESELFGFKKGAFTGALNDRVGLFEQASGGTFFLDEIGELSPLLQVKLLRVLEENKIRPLGSQEEVLVNIRVLSATNRDLQEEIKQGRFRMDLFYRLHVINIHVPPLRERPEDIPALIKHFLEKYNQRFGKNVISINRDALFGLMHYDYPGNVRELEAIIQHGVLLSDDNVITKTSLPPQVFQRGQLAIEGSRRDQTVNLDKAEEEMIKQALARFDGNQTEAAKNLGISRSTLWRKIKAYKLENFK